MASYNMIIGRAENIDIVDIVPSVPSKIDTGAYRSSIHATKIKVVGEGDAKVLTFELLGHPMSPVKYPMEIKEFEEVSVTNSFGHEEKRYEVILRVKMGPKVFNTSFTLADRANNFFPILIGRKFLRNRFIVDVTKASVDRMKLKKEFGISTPMDEEDLE